MQQHLLYCTIHKAMELEGKLHILLDLHALQKVVNCKAFDL